ncbi:hypothetical protein COCVIDRAFT_12634 [Bipolaris victoriae FI3]|uniref:Uncharacterized protein n=1 Tax=Bipolaris victoriae (strain FI3) TaxID=930091 RepID=W7ESI8_BIPV3|nr:hypothetical protein COCVIDRAFT_12634 [Bipolaris victoriae FI3]
MTSKLSLSVHGRLTSTSTPIIQVKKVVRYVGLGSKKAQVTGVFTGPRLLELRPRIVVVIGCSAIRSANCRANAQYAGYHLTRRIEAMCLFNFYPLSPNTLAKKRNSLLKGLATASPYIHPSTLFSQTPP